MDPIQSNAFVSKESCKKELSEMFPGKIIVVYSQNRDIKISWAEVNQVVALIKSKKGNPSNFLLQLAAGDYQELIRKAKAEIQVPIG